MATLLITKETGGYFSFVVDGNTAEKVTNLRNDVLAIGDICHFKTANGANIIKTQNINVTDITLIASGTFTFTNINNFLAKLIDVGYYDWLLGGGSGSGATRFDELIDTFQYFGKDGQCVIVNESQQKLETVVLNNVSRFTELIDTPTTIVPNKMLVGSNDATRLEWKTVPVVEQSLLSAFGTLHYSNSLTAQNATANVELKLLNDTLGVYTSLTNAPFGVSNLWNATTNQFDFSQLAVGDYVELRPDLDIDLVGSNTSFSVYMKMAIGGVNTWQLSIHNGERKSTDSFNEAPYIGFDISNEETKTLPAEIFIKTDANATVKVNGWLVAITRKSVNIIDIEAGDEYVINKQNNLTPDGTGTKYPTVDAVNNNLVHKTGNETIDGVKTFVQSPIVPTATTANQAVNFGQMNLQTVLDGGNSSTKGIVIYETEVIAVEGISENNTAFFGYSETEKASVFEIGSSNTHNISEFQKVGIIKAAITHEGKLQGADATEPNQAVMLGQLEAGLDTKLDASLYNDRFKGKFTSLANLEAALPTANAGDYAQVDAGSGSLVKNYNYDLEDGWVIGGTGSGATSTDTLIEGSTNLYFTTARVLSTLLSGISFATGGAIVSTDSVLTAFGKLQKQITDAIAELFWTKTGDNIRNNNVGDVEVKLAIGKKTKFLNNLNSEVTSIDHNGNLTANNILTNFVQLLGGARISSSGGGNRFLGFSNTQLSSDLPYVVDFNDVNLQPDDFYIGKVMGVEKFRITKDGKMVIAPATASNEAVNLGQLANENNVYLSHEFLSAISSEDFAITTVNSGSFGAGTATVNNVGVHRITSSTIANSGVGIRSSSLLLRLKGGEVFTYIFNPLTFTNTTNRMGIHDSTSSAVPANGVFFRYSGDGLLTLVTADNSVQTTSATIATLTTNTWYKVRFTVNANATSVLGELFNASGTLIASVTQTTNIPTTARALNVCAITTNSGTTATALLDVDFISLKTTLTR